MMLCNFNSSVKLSSPYYQEYARKCDVIDGIEVVSFVPVDPPVMPPAADFSLESLRLANIDPSRLSIATTGVTRASSFSEFEDIKAQAEAILNETDNG